MSEQLREALSAAVDGEASEFELRRVFDEMAKDEGLARAWQSYHLIKQATQGENVQNVALMGERIWASLDAEQFLEQDIVQEEPPSQDLKPAPSRRFGLIGGGLAAALALTVVVSGGLLDSDTGGAESAPLDQIVDRGLPAPALQSVGLSQANRQTGQSSRSLDGAVLGDDYDYGPGFVPYSELSPADQARSDGYFLHHVQHQAVNNDNVLSFVKMISYPQ